MSSSSRSPGKDADEPDSLITLRNAAGEELVLEAGNERDPQQRVVATDSSGNSLTLLEEYALRKQRSGPLELGLSFLCASASLAFAALIYIKTH